MKKICLIAFMSLYGRECPFFMLGRLWMTAVFVCGCFIGILQMKPVEGRYDAIFTLCLLRMSKK